MKTNEQENITKDWPHAPVHRLDERGAYMVTCGCYQKHHHLNTRERLTLVQSTLFEQAARFQWQLQAWAILSNHYHFVAISPENSQSLRKFITALHRITAIELNKMDDASERKVWYQYYDSRITYQKSYLARLRYVHENAVHHGIVDSALDYPWCSATWLRQNATSGFRKTLESFKIDKLKVMDDF